MQKSFISPLYMRYGVSMAKRLPEICLKCRLVIVLLLLLQSALAQFNPQELDKKLIQKQELLGKDHVVLIWKKNDTILYKKESGDYTSRTVAPIASCSKWLTAAIVMTYIDEGKLSLDDKVSKWLPEFERYGKGYITIRHCLSHMTGIESGPIRIRKLLERKKIKSLEEEVNSFAAKEIQANAGVEFHYSNIGLNIAARVLEVMTKKKFEMIALQRLFRPLGMSKTTFVNPDGSPPNPSGGARSNADDYMKFLVMLLNKGTYQGKKILSEQAVGWMLEIQTKKNQLKYAPASAEGFNYALGSWVIEEKDGKPNALASPGLFGTWPMIDYCRGYAYILFVKNFLGDEKAEAHMEIKKVIDEQFECK